MALILQYAPIRQPITQVVNPRQPWEQFNASGMVTKDWQDFFRYAAAILNTAPQLIGSVELTAQGAAIAATTIPTTFPTLPNERLLPGIYRVSYYTRITRAATTSSELTVSIRWVDGGVTITQAGTLLNGNTTSIYQTSSFLIRCDTETQVSYLTAYASVGGTSMQYRLNLKLEAVPEAA